MSRAFKRELKESLEGRRPLQVTGTPKPTTQWWSRIHGLVLVMVLCVAVGGGIATHTWLDGRSVSEGLHDLLNKAEAAQGNQREDTLDVPATVYQDCGALNEVYPAGISSTSHPKTYKANKALDIDRDGWACEDG